MLYSYWLVHIFELSRQENGYTNTQKIQDIMRGYFVSKISNNSSSFAISESIICSDSEQHSQ